jgi:hypothetical protein
MAHLWLVDCDHVVAPISDLAILAPVQRVGHPVDAHRHELALQDHAACPFSASEMGRVIWDPASLTLHFSTDRSGGRALYSLLAIRPAMHRASGQTACTVYPLGNYSFGVKEKKKSKAETTDQKLANLRTKCVHAGSG